MSARQARTLAYRVAGLAAAALLLTARRAWAVDSTATAPAASAQVTPTDDRLILSGDGSTLTGTSGGEGGSLNFLHSMPHVILGAGGEYQKLADASWEFGSLSGALSGTLGDMKWSLDGEAHRGAGNISNVETLVVIHDLESDPRLRAGPTYTLGTRHFDYGVEALGVSGTFFNELTLQLESRQFDIDTTHGNLPKIGVGMLWRRHWLTTVSYARSVSGNLGTELVTLRIDHFGRTVNWLAGAAAGHVAPPVVNIQTGATGAAPKYREGYVGLTKVFPRVELALLGDYLDLSGSRRITLTLTMTIHVHRTGA